MMATFFHIALVIFLGSTVLGLVIAGVFSLGRVKAARQAEDEWLNGEPPTSLEAQRRGYCGARCPHCKSLRLAALGDGYSCLSCGETAR